MSAAEQVQLKKAGDMLTLNVMACAQVPVGKYPEIEFTGVSANRLVAVRVNKQSVDRQLTRLELTQQTVVGKVLIFTRDPNPADVNKPYWGINLAADQSSLIPVQPDVGTPLPTPRPDPRKQGFNLGPHIPGLDEAPPHDDRDAPNAAPARQAAVQEPASNDPARAKLDASFKLYDECFHHAVATAGKYPGLDTDVSAMAATIFIQANKF